jgi:phosphopantetheine--protein transferase-like protein
MCREQVGIGVDIVQIERFERLVRDIGIPFVERIFTPSEVAVALERPDPVQSLAGMFSLKEAVVKSLPHSELTLLDLDEIEIGRKHDLSVEVDFLNNYNYRISGSIAHDGNYAIGVAILL